MQLSPYVWPSQRGDLESRISCSFVLLILAKLATVAMPYAFKWATDALTEICDGAVLPTSALAGPVALTLLYGGLRVAMVGLTQARDALFAAVAMNAVRRLALDVFVHLHAPADALPSRTQDRRPDPRAGARPQRHRDADPPDHADGPSHRARVRADVRRAVLPVRLRAMRRSSLVTVVALSVLHHCSPPTGASASAAR